MSVNQYLTVTLVWFQYSGFLINKPIHIFIHIVYYLCSAHTDTTGAQLAF